jgi:hypothetical protein
MPRVHVDEFSYAPLNIWVGSDEVGDDGSYFCSVLPYILRTSWDWHRDCPRKVKSTQYRNVNRWTTDPLHILSPVSVPPPPLLSRYYSSMYKGELLPFINKCGSSDHLIQFRFRPLIYPVLALMVRYQEGSHYSPLGVDIAAFESDSKLTFRRTSRDAKSTRGQHAETHIDTHQWP